MPTHNDNGVAPASPSRTVLVVEDDDDTRAALTDLLEDRGYTVAAARNGREALSYLAHECPGCIVLDLWMPVMDGWTFANEVYERQLPVPMLVITAAEPYWGYPIPPRLVLRKPLDSGKFLGLLGSLLAA
jgi:two-component system chemotaxis response regulator CheY